MSGVDLIHSTTYLHRGYISKEKTYVVTMHWLKFMDHYNNWHFQTYQEDSCNFSIVKYIQ